MLCPVCKTEMGTKVIETAKIEINGDSVIKRRRKCLNSACKYRFNTLESVNNDYDRRVKQTVNMKGD